MALTRLTNLIATRNGRMLYVNPDDFNSTDLLSNNGNSPTRPFKTLQRALLEVARFSYVQGQNNDKYDQFTINLAPGDYIIDNRPGKANTAEVPELSDQSNFEILDPNNDLYKFNSVEGGLVIPRGTSIVGMDLRKTRVRPRYVPDPANSSIGRTSIFRVTGACYFWQFSLFDALPSSDSSGQGGVYSSPSSTAIVNSNYSHHKVTCFTYADQSDLDLFYAKAARAFASIPTTAGQLESRVQETRIVGPLQQAGQKGINSAVVSGSIVTIVTDGPHEVFEGQQITIEDITGSYSSLNGTYYVTKVNNDSEFTVTAPGFTAGVVPPVDLLNAIVKAEIDTVDSSSPYIFNCSLRSTYGLCGLWADGDRVSGFKSMVVAQFTGVSLQKDDRAFVKFTETTTPNPSFVLEGGASDSIALHQDSAGYVFYRGDATEGWRHYHIRVSNNAFIQSVSVFAVGYAEQHLIENGGDYSITNSNSNFGTQALIADGFRPDAFTLDKKGYISHIVPPQSLGTQETEVPYYPLDVQKSRAGIVADGVGSKLYLFEQTDPNNTPVFDINQYKLGGRISDKIFANLTNPANSRIQEFDASIAPSGIEEHLITSVSVATNTFTTQSTNNFETATPIRIYSSTGYLPFGMESNRLYYAIKINNTSFKIAPSEEDARAGAGGAQNSIVNIRSNVPAGAIITVKAYVSDTNPVLPRFDVTVNANQETFSTGTFPHGFTTGDKVFFKRRIVSGITQTGQLPLIQAGGTVQSLSLTTEYYVYVVDSFTFKIADSESNANNNVPIPIDTNGDVNVLTVYRNIQKSPLRYDPTQSNWYVAVRADITNKIHPILTSSNSSNIYSNPSLSNTENTFLRRLSDDRAVADRTYRLRYVIPKTELNARPPLIGYVVRRKTDANNQVIPYNTSTLSGQTDDFDRVYYIYRSNTVLKHIPGEQDGIYYLTVLMADVGPKGAQFNSPTDTFGFLQYSQDVGKIYPDLDKDNPIADPDAAVTVADNLVHGLVYQDDDRSSITKECISQFIADCGYSPSLNAISGKAVSGQENRLIAFNANIPNVEVELRRTSQIRAGNQTFEYTGFGSGNYSTGFPSKQERVLTDKEVLYSQAQRRRAGVVFYSGLNAYGDLYVGNQKINAVTGEVEILDKPILRVAGSAAVGNDEFVPYVSGTKNVNIEGTLVTGGGANKTANAFNNETLFNEGIKVSTKDPTEVNRALTTHDVNYRPKGLALESSFSNGTVKQTALLNCNLRPTPGVEGVFLGDKYFKNTLSTNTRHEGYIYVGSDPNTGTFLNGGWRQIGLVGVGHLTSIEETYAPSGSASCADIEPYGVTGKFGINKTNPQASLHVGTGDVIFDNTLTVQQNLNVTGNTVITGDLAVNGGDITSTSPSFNLLNQSTTVGVFTSATTISVGAPTGTITVNNPLSILNGNLQINGIDNTAEITTNSTTFNFLANPSQANINAATVSAFSGATFIDIGNNTGQTRVNHDLLVVGNLKVQGTTTNINSTVTTIVDPVITLGGTADGADLTASDGKDRGLELKYYDSSSKLGFMGWDDDQGRYHFLKDATNTGEVFSGTDAEIRVGKITVSDNSNAFDYIGSDPFSTWNPTTKTYNSASFQVSSGFKKVLEKYSLPVGVVTMWSGSLASIPEGWTLCDGTTKIDRDGNTVTVPDLRERFILGASSDQSDGINPQPVAKAFWLTDYEQTGGSFTQTVTSENNNVEPTLTYSYSASVSGHRLTRQQLPAHRHGINHGHGNVQIVQVPHGHAIQGSKGNAKGTLGNELNDNGGTFGASDVGVSAEVISIFIELPKNVSTVDGNLNTNGGAWGGPANGWDAGVMNDLGEAPGSFTAAEHSHNLNFSFDASLNNTIHQHSVFVNTTPPFYALAFIYKL